MDSISKNAAFAAAALAGASALRGRGVPPTWAGLKSGLRDAMANDPMDALAVTVLGGSFLFWLAERGENPKVESIFDAFVFVTTNLSVGYCDIFAKTPAGKAIASAIMTIGPAMAASALDPPAGEKREVSPEVMAVAETISSKLDAILGELRAQRGAA